MVEPFYLYSTDLLVHITPIGSRAGAGELVPDYQLSLADQLHSSWQWDTIINGTNKSCHRRGRATFVRSFFHNSVTTSRYPKITCIDCSYSPTFDLIQRVGFFRKRKDVLIWTPVS